MTLESSSGGTRLSLLARARARDGIAWRELVELYTPLIAHWLRRCGLDPSDTADCVQEVFASVAISLGSYEPQISSGSFRAWIWTITRNKVRDLVRKKARQPITRGGSTAWEAIRNAPDEAAIPDTEPTDGQQINELVRRGLEQVRNEFEPTTWQAFWRTAIDGVPTAVVADELGMTSAAIRQSRSRIMRRLRQQLGDVN